MKPENFCYWLQGYFELLGDVRGLDENKCKIIKEHLLLVFKSEPQQFTGEPSTIKFPNWAGTDPNKWIITC